MDQPDTRTIEGREYPRVSRILDFVPDPPRLAEWKRTASLKRLALGKAKGKAKARLGTIVHETIAGEVITPAMLSEYEEAWGIWQELAVESNPDHKIAELQSPDPYIEAEANWMKESGAEIERTEEQVWSKKFGFCGTLDRRVMIDGLRFILDYKTGKEGPKQMIQGSAYRVADYERSGDESVGVIMLYLKPTGKFKEARKYDTTVEFFWFTRALSKYYRELGTK